MLIFCIKNMIVNKGGTIMKNFETIIDETYEFFDELLGSVIPGVYFCSYFVFCGFAVAFTLSGNINLLNGQKYITISILVIAYVIGTMCRRSNSREPDNISARHLYFNSIPRDDNDFAFNPLVTDRQFKRLIRKIKHEVKCQNINIELDEKILSRKKDFTFLEKIKSKIRSAVLFSQNNGKKYNETILSKPNVQRYIYQKLLTRKAELDITTDASKLENKNIDDFIKKNNLEDSCEIYVDYPYSNLKRYLENRNMNDLAKLVTWNHNESKKTSRSKSIICNMKLYIKHKSPSDYGHLLKTEAHIRFMNSMWYANKIISAISFCMLFISIAISGLLSLICHFGLLKTIKPHLSEKSLVFYYNLKDYFESLFRYAFRSEFEWDRLLGAFMFVFVISFAYRCLSKLIIKTIKNNFHYQRVREVVSVLYVYNMLINQKDN